MELAEAYKVCVCVFESQRDSILKTGPKAFKIFQARLDFTWAFNILFIFMCTCSCFLPWSLAHFTCSTVHKAAASLQRLSGPWGTWDNSPAKHAVKH